MNFTIAYTSEARAEIKKATKYIAENSPLNARRWKRGLDRAVESLSEMPERCPIAPDSQYVEMELRHLIYKSH